MIGEWKKIAFLGLLAWGFAGCGSQEKPGVIARVGDREITDEEFKGFVAALPEGLKSQKQGLDGQREHLQSLVDKELLLLEAQKRGLEEDSAFLRKLNSERDRRLLKAFYEREIRSAVEIAEDELRAYFVTTGRDRERKLRLLNFETREAAEAALNEIRKGKAFAVLAARDTTVRERSALGDLGGKFLAKDAVPLALRDQVFSLKPGQVSGPIAFRKNYLLVQVVEERPADFARYRGVLRSRLEREKLKARRESLVQELRVKYAVSLKPEALQRFLRQWRETPRGMAWSPDTAVCEYRGGRITAEYLADRLESHGFEARDSARVADFTEGVVLPEVLFLEEARRLGLAAEVGAEMDRHKGKMLVDELLLKEVVGKVQVSYEEARAFHEGHPEIFSGPEQVEVQEILVETEAEARALLEQLRDGADADSLAAEYTLRPAGKNNKGRFHFHLFEAPLYGGLVEAAQKAPLHQLQGPVKVEGGYSLFWVLGRKREPSSFEDKRVQFAVKNILTKIKQNELFDALVARLRQNYRDQVHIFEKELARVGQAAQKEAMPPD